MSDTYFKYKSCISYVASPDISKRKMTKATLQYTFIRRNSYKPKPSCKRKQLNIYYKSIFGFLEL